MTLPSDSSSSVEHDGAGGDGSTGGARTARRSELQSLRWVAVSVGGFVLFASWFWLGLTVEGARQDRGQAGQDYADAYVRELGVMPVVTAHIVVLLTVVSLSAWSRQRGGAGITSGVLICATASVAGLLLSIPLFAAVPTLP